MMTRSSPTSARTSRMALFRTPSGSSEAVPSASRTAGMPNSMMPPTPSSTASAAARFRESVVCCTHAGHGGDGVRLGEAFADEGREDQFGRRQPVFRRSAGAWRGWCAGGGGGGSGSSWLCPSRCCVGAGWAGWCAAGPGARAWTTAATSPAAVGSSATAATGRPSAAASAAVERPMATSRQPPSGDSPAAMRRAALGKRRRRRAGCPASMSALASAGVSTATPSPGCGVGGVPAARRGCGPRVGRVVDRAVGGHGL